ncbi:MAG: hypothetical protein AAB377_00915 [Patescibacteria group bacterium]
MNRGIFKKIFDGWMKFGLIIGNFVSGVVLVFFYFTIFALFALPFRLFGKNPLAVQSKTSNWIKKEKTPTILKDFENEF